MPFTQDQENAVRLITETAIEQELDRRIHRRILLLNVWTGALTIGAIACLVFLFIQLPDIAVGRLLGRLADIQSNLTTSIEQSRKANENSQEASNTAQQALTKANIANTDVERAQQLANNMNPQLLEEAKNSADAIIALAAADNLTKALTESLASRPIVLTASLRNDEYEQQNAKAPGYWRSEGRRHAPVPMNADMSVTLDRPSVALLTGDRADAG